MTATLKKNPQDVINQFWSTWSVEQKLSNEVGTDDEETFDENLKMLPTAAPELDTNAIPPAPQIDLDPLY